ncbi:hypothetical protein XA68_18306 [Ophiocordyceps unilateralis]|uniref:DUF6590 domain-containing protein n=1 Tax=Ophiocordyceps unilateralis TaxID=268505 RepID=A0A2A9P3J2_OPHUN|nr:hypothetical protein XA68_18306 [Ophiocordyceps unilateralis]
MSSPGSRLQQGWCRLQGAQTDESSAYRIAISSESDVAAPEATPFQRAPAPASVPRQPSMSMEALEWRAQAPELLSGATRVAARLEPHALQEPLTAPFPMPHKHKSKAHPWGPWSEWAWDESRGRWYRVRQDVNGTLDYDWDNRQTTPREVEQLTQDFRNLSPGSSYDAQADEYTVAKEKSKSLKANKSKGKHRSHDDADDAAARAPYRAVPSGAGSAYVPCDDAKYTGYEPSSSAYYAQPSADPRAAPAYSGASPSSRNASQSQGREPADEELQAAATRALYYGDRSGVAGSSTAAYGPYCDDDEEGPPTPKARITADEEMLDELDPRYRVEHSNKFNPGEIFKVHWSEPQGSGNEHAPSVSGRQEIQNRFGTKFFVGFRRFIVIANDLGHSTCVPILTYGGKGCKKRGVKPAKHGIIHERGHKARLLEGEPKLGFPPIRVEMTEEGEKLSKESRVNYSKLVTVEHNVKVFFIGSVVANDWDIVQDAVNRCWSEKNHHKKRSK